MADDKTNGVEKNESGEPKVIDAGERIVRVLQASLSADGASVTVWHVGGAWPEFPGVYETNENGEVVIDKDTKQPRLKKEPFTVDKIDLLYGDAKLNLPAFYEVVGFPIPGSEEAAAQIVMKSQVRIDTAIRVERVLTRKEYDDDLAAAAEAEEVEEGADA